MSGHTPGPWAWWTSCSFRRLSAVRDGDVLHAVVQRGDGHPDIHFPNGGYEGPDALLIAAAPELLEALREARAALAAAIKSAWNGATDDDVADNLIIKQIDAAIAKATGAQS